jgi:hypothetical protein
MPTHWIKTLPYPTFRSGELATAGVRPEISEVDDVRVGRSFAHAYGSFGALVGSLPISARASVETAAKNFKYFHVLK